jgi:adenylate kinase family enzyme
MNRVVVIGAPGAGKTRFGRMLAERTGLPLVHLDQEFWQPGWVPMPHDKWRAHHENLLAAEQWILDGTYVGTLDKRIAVADTVIYLDVGRLRCIARIIKRTIGSLGRQRPDIAPGCPEKIDLKFIAYAWRFHNRERRIIEEQLANASAIVLRLQGDVDIEKFLDELES